MYLECVKRGRSGRKNELKTFALVQRCKGKWKDMGNWMEMVVGLTNFFALLKWEEKWSEMGLIFQFS